MAVFFERITQLKFSSKLFLSTNEVFEEFFHQYVMPNQKKEVQSCTFHATCPFFAREKPTMGKKEANPLSCLYHP